jgi:hypothetical protein
VRRRGDLGRAHMLGCPPGRCEPERLPLPLPFAATSSPLLLAGADAAFPPFFFPLAATLRHPPAVKAEPRNDTAPSAHDIAPRCCCFLCPFALSDPAQWTSDTAFGFAGCRTADSVRPLGPLYPHTRVVFFMHCENAPRITREHATRHGTEKVEH